MKTLTTLLKYLGLTVILASIPLLGGCSDNTMTWQEEVKLLDGRTITVTQKRRYEGVYTGQNFGSVPREAWLTITLPEFGNKEITWNENLMPRIVNVYKGVLYVVGWPPTGKEFYQYDKPKPSYIGFKHESGKWLRIPFVEIPEAIYDTNLWIENNPPNKSGRVSLTDKAEEILDRRLDKDLKRVDPNYKSNFH